MAEEVFQLQDHMNETDSHFTQGKKTHPKILKRTLKVIGNTFQQNFEYNFIAYTNTLGNIKCGLFFQICNMRATDHN